MTTDLKKLLNESPKNWRQWGQNDQIGALNYLKNDDILNAIQSIKYGKTFTLGLEMGCKKGNPAYPSSAEFSKFTVQDKSTYDVEKITSSKGGLQFTEEVILTSTHGTTHCDALGHTWFDDKMYNGYSSKLSINGLDKLSIKPIAEKGIVGRAVLLDIARYKNLDYLPMGYHITLEDILETAKYQNTEIKQKDIILIRTGIFKLFYEKGSSEYFKNFNEPGLTYEINLVKWFDKMEIPVYGTDTITNEQMISSLHEEELSLHASLCRNLGIVFIESLDLEEYSIDCEKDKKYDGLFISSPLKINGASASPINPIIIK